MFSVLREIERGGESPIGTGRGVRGCFEYLSCLFIMYKGGTPEAVNGQKIKLLNTFKEKHFSKKRPRPFSVLQSNKSDPKNKPVSLAKNDNVTISNLNSQLLELINKRGGIHHSNTNA